MGPKVSIFPVKKLTDPPTSQLNLEGLDITIYFADNVFQCCVVFSPQLLPSSTKYVPCLPLSLNVFPNPNCSLNQESMCCVPLSAVMCLCSVLKSKQSWESCKFQFVSSVFRLAQLVSPIVALLAKLVLTGSHSHQYDLMIIWISNWHLYYHDLWIFVNSSTKDLHSWYIDAISDCP